MSLGFESFLKCPEHGVQYPTGSKCPPCEKAAEEGRVPFTKEAITKYLDRIITHWRMCDATPEMRSNYIDAYQSVRVSLFGEVLPPEKIESGSPADQEAST